MVASRSPSSASTSTTWACTEAAQLEEYRDLTYDNYRRLLDIGGRPTTNLDGFEYVGKDLDLSNLDFWHDESDRTRDELSRWEHFRQHQQDVRTKLRRFKMHNRDFQNFLSTRSVELLQLQLDWRMQTKILEWWEYLFHESSKRSDRLATLAFAQRTLKVAESKVQNAESAFSIDDEATIAGRAGEVIAYKERLASALSEIEAAQLGFKWRTDGVQAQTIIEAAQKALGAMRSDEMESLIEAYERVEYRRNLQHIQSSINDIELGIRHLDNVLRFVETEVPNIMAESRILEGAEVKAEEPPRRSKRIAARAALLPMTGSINLEIAQDESTYDKLKSCLIPKKPTCPRRSARIAERQRLERASETGIDPITLKTLVRAPHRTLDVNSLRKPQGIIKQRISKKMVNRKPGLLKR